MSEDYRQRLSELQDGELPAAEIPELLEALAADPELRACWERYTLIGQAMRGEVLNPKARQLADRVQAALAREAGGLNPGSRLRKQRSRRQLAGLALAASALLAALSIPILLNGGFRTQGWLPLAGHLDRPHGLILQRWQLERPELAHKLDRYLLTHQAAAPATSAKGFLPYAMLVSDTGGR